MPSPATLLTRPMDNPLVPNDAAAEEAFQQRTMAKAALARSVGDWWDIFEEISTHQVVKTMEAHGDSAVDALKDWKDDKITVRREFVAHGLPLTEEVEVEGPMQDPSRPTDQTAILWPMGQQITLFWPDGSKLHFRGRKALIAFTFVLWWDGFQSAYKINMGQQEEQQSRLIAPGSAEWDEYYKRKNADLKKGIS